MSKTMRNAYIGLMSLVFIAVTFVLRGPDKSSTLVNSSDADIATRAANTALSSGNVNSTPRESVEPSGIRDFPSSSFSSTTTEPVSEVIELIIRGDKASAASRSEFSAQATAQAVYEIKWQDFIDSFQFSAAQKRKTMELLIHYQARNAELSHQFVSGLITLDESSAGKIALSELEERFLEVLTPEQFEEVIRVDNEYKQATSSFMENAVEIRRSEGITDIMDFALDGDLEQLRSHVLAGADVNAKDFVYERTALMDASANGHREIVSFLIEAGANINETDSIGSSALESAIHGGKDETVRILVDAGAEINTVNEMGISPLMLSTFYKSRGDAYARINQILLEAESELE